MRGAVYGSTRSYLPDFAGNHVRKGVNECVLWSSDPASPGYAIDDTGALARYLAREHGELHFFLAFQTVLLDCLPVEWEDVRFHCADNGSKALPHVFLLIEEGVAALLYGVVVAHCFRLRAYGDCSVP